mmetsp:Transcript_27199/g.30918  ORF Transcript_27199/g.30918 Transcript_27199/m.30918 type:complete len:219 (+) Transcript_27199:216-872(+)
MVNINNFLTKNKSKNKHTSKSKKEQTSSESLMSSMSVVTCPVSNVSEEGREKASARRIQTTSSGSSKRNIAAILSLPQRSRSSQPVDLDEMMDKMAVEQQDEYEYDVVSHTGSFETVPLSDTRSYHSSSSDTLAPQNHRKYLSISLRHFDDSSPTIDKKSSSSRSCHCTSHSHSNNNSNSNNNNNNHHHSKNSRNMIVIERRLNHLGWLYQTRSAVRS